ncbi:hypothetical protein DL771_001026 [Monosporascus sp. 5C6A]|nr:hypothetical protein DL771_001026 [Monosporascus sp. 5C6A]
MFPVGGYFPNTKPAISSARSSVTTRELAKTLYGKNARVYIAGRSEENVRQAIRDIESAVPTTGGSLECLQLDLADLGSIKASVDAFKARESKLEVLWNNAGVSQPPLGSVSKQGIELQLATNCFGPFLLTQLLVPLLEAACSANGGLPGSVRVVWTSSQMVELSAPSQGLIMSEVRAPPRDKARNYVNSKTGNVFLASEFARHTGSSRSIISVCQNPGAAATKLFRHTPWLNYVAYPLLHNASLGALTALYAGLSKDITLDMNGRYVVPWGRVYKNLRADLVEAMKPGGRRGKW